MKCYVCTHTETDCIGVGTMNKIMNEKDIWFNQYHINLANFDISKVNQLPFDMFGVLNTDTLISSQQSLVCSINYVSTE